MLSHSEIKDLKLQVLLNITKAINNNASVAELLEMYKDFLSNVLSIKRFCLFVNNSINNAEGDWGCLINEGLKTKRIVFDKELLLIKDIETLTTFRRTLSKDFDVVIPVYHKDLPLAYLLMGEVNPHKIGMSPVIQHLPFVQTLTNIIVVAIENKKLYRQSIQRAEINKEIELAKQVQSMLLPQQLPFQKNLKITAEYIPFSLVGGDYYDIIKLNNHEYIFCIADVSGKGISAALLMSNIQAALHTAIEFTHNLKDIIIHINKRVLENAKGEKFVSLFLGKINLYSRQLTYINAGHNPPFAWKDNQLQLLDKGTTLLGFMENLAYVEVTILEYSQQLLLFSYTDGLTDFLDEHHLNFNELVKFVEKYKKRSVIEIKKQIINWIKKLQTVEYTLKDDVAMLIIEAD